MFFAVLDENSIVINTIVCDNIETAELVTGKTCIEYEEATEENIDQGKTAVNGFKWNGTKFEQPE